MDKRVKKAISDELDGILFLGRLTPAFLALSFAFFPWAHHDYDGADIYFFIAGPMIFVMFIVYTAIEVYLNIAKPLKAHIYTFYAAYRIWILAFFHYAMSVDALLWYSSYSQEVRNLQLLLIGIGFWGSLYYFRFVFLPKRFKAANGIKQAIESTVLDPDKGLYRIGVEWTRAVVNPESFERSTLMERQPWLYAVFIGVGTVALSLLEFDKLDYFSIGGSFFGALSVFFSIMTAFSWHDHAIVRQWEKEHGRVLQVKA